MTLQIADILTRHQCAAIRDALGDQSLWRDGKETAGGAAKAAKSNLQADSQMTAAKGAIAKIRASLTDSEVFQAAAQPSQIARILLSRYDPGMAYGDHVDAAYIGGFRADLSFTLFLTDPADYEGGALVIDSAGAEETIKLEAGSLVLYPSTAVHRVEPVSSGMRLACVGWIQSKVRNGDQRSILFDLERAIADIPMSPLRLQLVNIRNNLLRNFGD